MEAASCQFKPLCTGRKRLANASGAAPLRAAPLRQCTMLSVLLRAIDETRGCLVSSIDETGPWATWPKVGRSRDTQAPTHGAATVLQRLLMSYGMEGGELKKSPSSLFSA
jgi:hypothetical protein